MDTSRYADLFLTESQEHLSAINHALLDLERAPESTEPVNALFRAVHTIKGMSATMGYVQVAELAHALETLLDQLRIGSRQVTGEVIDALFTASDTLEVAVGLSVAGRDAEIDVAGPLERLRALDGGVPGAAAANKSHIATKSAAGAAAAAWTTPAPGGDGILVRVRIAPDAPLRGVRAFMVVQALRALGTVARMNPPLDELKEEQFGDDFAVRLVTTESPERVTAVVAALGDVAGVLVESGAAAG
ncbi:MAG TPA: Hpt domain-containing protein, partial [Gemmatimonadaceae bacterium]|nr:Hpt domain-containing protein [Gemmatimonadaceae bacterium]